MTKFINQPPNPDPKKPNLFKRVVNKLKSSPKTVATGAVAIAALGGLAYWGTQVLVKKKLPPFLESQIGKIIERPIDLGEVKGFSLGGIEFGKTVIPPTATDTDKVTVEGVKVGFNVFPVLFRRTLPLDVTLMQPDIYLEQEQDGEWINLDFLAKDPNEEKKDPLVYFDVDIDVEEADITAVPYEQNPLKAQVDGSGKFHQKKEFLAYDLDAGIEKAKAKIQGETQLKTGATDTKLLVEDLALADVATFLPGSLKLDSGMLNADLDIDIPSLEEITAANVKGMVNLSNAQGQIKDLDAAVKAKSQLNFDGRNAQVQQTEASLDNITAQIAGKVNLDTGYDLNVEVLPFQLASIPKGLTKQVPVDLAGEVTGQVKVVGAIKDPQVTGKINNTQNITIDKTAFSQIDADFRADLAQVVLENLQLKPVAGGSVTASGTLETNLRQALEGDKKIDAVTMPLNFSFQADLPSQKLITPYYQLPQQVVVGQLKAQGKVDGTIENPNAIVNWNIAEAKTGSSENIAGGGKLTLAENKLALRDTEITYGDGKADVEADANLKNKKWQASLDANSLNLTPFLAQANNPNLNLDRPIEVQTAQAKFNGSLDKLDPQQINGNADLNLDVDGGSVVVNTQLSSGNIEAKTTTSNIQLDRLVTSLPVATALTSGTINAKGKLKQLLEFDSKNPNFNSINADADLNLQVDGEAVAVNSQVDSGRFQANANTSQINLNRIAPNLPVPASVRSSQVKASGELKQLLTFAKDPNLNTVDAQVDADLEVANGTVKAIANLNNNQWQADVDANNVSTALLLKRFAPEQYRQIQLDNLNAQANLSGSINPILNNEINVPVAINNFTANSGTQNVNAQGNLTLANVTSNLDVANTNLDVAANLDFDSLPIKQVVASASKNNELVADSVNIGGKAAFNGQFNGKQLISAPSKPGNVNLTGDLSLENFAFNDIVFDPVMTGTVNVQPQQQIALNLTGEQDVIAASAVPCEASDCKLPYLPNNLELRQGEDTSQPIIATGNRNGDVFSLDINNFPLALLNIAPAKAAGIEGALAGKTTGNVDLNLKTLAADGNIAIAQPGVGYIQADKLNAAFDYDPVNNLAEVTSSTLDFGDSKYSLNAALNLDSGQIDGKLNIPEAYIQDALTTFRWFTIADVTSLFNIPDYGETAAVKPAPEKDVVDISIARKLNQLRNVNRQIQANAAEQEANSIPTELDIEGRYAGEIILGGTIQTPKADFKVEGENWQWQTIEAYADIVSPLGLVIEESQAIEIPKLAIIGELQGTTVNLQEASIKVQEALLSLEGKLSTDKQDAKFAIANLTVDNIGNFVNIPVDLAGEINSLGTIKGTLDNPQLEGKVAFTKGAFNGNILPAKIAGDFDYNGSKLGFNTTAPDSIRVEANVPYPIIPGKSDRFTAKADLAKEAFVLLEPLSQNYLRWVDGEGNAQLEANARLDLEREGVIYDLVAQGVVNLKDANVAVTTPFFTENFVGTGKITLENQIVNVETLNAIFAEKDLSITGKLPILTAVKNLENPLTINLPKEGDINIDKLYKGGVAGKVMVTGASLKPSIGGEVTLENGKVSIPKTEVQQEDAVQIAKTQTTSALSGNKALPKAQGSSQGSAAKSSFVTALDNFKVNLKDFKLEQNPVYKFQLEGDLLLNGTVDEPSNIIPEGTLMLTGADVNLFSTEFNLARNRDNTIIFTPDAGVFNPALDIALRTEVEDIDNQEFNSLRTVETNSNEINDPLSQGSNSNTIRINLAVNGDTEEILPNLASTSTNCNIRPVDSPMLENQQNYSQAELNRLTECFNETSLSTGNGRNLISSPAVELTSTPSLDQGEIVSLLSGQFLDFANNFGGGGGDQSSLLRTGLQTFVIDPALDSFLFKVEDATVSFGKKIDLDYLTIYPNLEGLYEISQDSSLRFTYTHNLFNSVIDTINNTEEDDTTNSQEVRLEYRRNF